MIRTVDDFLEQTCKKFANKRAFVMQDKSLSFGEFNELAKALASEILRKNIKKSPILILLPKSLQALISFFASIKSGNFYSILDEKSPRQRIERVIRILKPELIIKSKNTPNFNVNSIDIEDIKSFEIDEPSLNEAKKGIIDTDLQYVLFTSGSTGEPKGVSISHKSVIDYAFFFCKTFKVDENEIIANQAPLFVDASLPDILATVKTGATLHLIANSKFVFVNEILSYLEKEKISMIFFKPTVLSYLARDEENLKNFDLRNLKKFLVGGEIMPTKILNIYKKIIPNALFANCYGPTEITDVCCYYIVDREFSDDELLPIGKACENTQLLVFDENLKLITKPNEKGELFVRGTCLSLGYYANEEQSKESFIQNPLHNNYKDLVYKTGDIVAYNERGELLCYGRKDTRIKYKGYRIELAEIESLINSHSKVRLCACVFKEEIFCFYESDEELNLKAFLGDKLPAYMIPRSFIRVDEFRLNANSKIDRKALYERL